MKSMRDTNREYFIGSKLTETDCSDYQKVDFQDKDTLSTSITNLSRKRSTTAPESSELAAFGVNLANCQSKILGKAE
jgi:hypothetical protein